MEDEAGIDGKVLAVPTIKVLGMYSAWKNIEDVNPARLKALAHFFEHYKDLEEGKWVKVLGWEGIEAAHKEIVDGLANYDKSQAGCPGPGQLDKELTPPAPKHAEGDFCMLFSWITRSNAGRVAYRLPGIVLRLREG